MGERDDGTTVSAVGARGSEDEPASACYGGGRAGKLTVTDLPDWGDMQLSTPTGETQTEPRAMQRARRILGREFVAWSLIALIAMAAVFIQSCPDHAKADELAAAWSESSAWAAMFGCHQAFIPPTGGLQGS
jgi:hypothetical protein